MKYPAQLLRNTRELNSKLLSSMHKTKQKTTIFCIHLNLRDQLKKKTFNELNEGQPQKFQLKTQLKAYQLHLL